MKNPLRASSPLSRCVDMVSSVNEPWLRPHTLQFARARRPTAKR